MLSARRPAPYHPLDRVPLVPRGTAFAAPFPLFLDMTSSDLPGQDDPALRVSDSRIHPYVYG